MLERPSLADEKIMSCLQAEYGLLAAEIVFLPLGADMNTAVFRVDTDTANDAPYFLKLRRGHFDTITVDLPKFLFEQGITEIIAPIPTRSGQLSAHLDAFNAILYPFIEGQSGWERNLSDQDWVTFGRVLKAIHTTTLPPELANHISHESYSPQWRDMVKQFQAQVEVESFSDPSAVGLATLMKDKRTEISHLIQRAEDLGAVLQSQPANLVLCHSDIHVGNILISSSDDLYIVDWDQPLLSPKERDLMFIGAGIDGRGEYAEHDEHLFYEGYGQTVVDPIALTY